ncbi:hypothetical protein [Catelliglobosispora koreensis]|uniref:hypothetical protein n=1 Tax=Catelliglobosispora koreensis TaxID=129052 RepID=UPI0003AAA34C|nr:hypothetical protein [Catelliglobosispora koreensis]
MALPFAVTIGNAVQVKQAVLLSSISGAYYTGMRDVFVGSLCAIGVFLICYRYARPDDILGTIAGFAAIVVALFPTTAHDDQLLVSTADTPKGVVHGVAAIILFLVLAIFCFFIFPRSIHPQAMTARKKARNITYYICGILIVLGLATAAFGSKLLPADIVSSVRPMFWGESIAVLAFGVAWFAKSNTFLPDIES